MASKARRRQAGHLAERMSDPESGRVRRVGLIRTWEEGIQAAQSGSAAAGRGDGLHGPRSAVVAGPGPADRRQSRCISLMKAVASSSASWYRCGWVRRSAPPSGADRASSTEVTIAAHSAVRSPRMTPTPSTVVSTDTDRSSRGSSSGSSSGSGPAVRSRISAQIAASPRRSTPACAAVTTISSARCGTPRGSPWSTGPPAARRTWSAPCPAARPAAAHAWWPGPGWPCTPRPGPW